MARSPIASHNPANTNQMMSLSTGIARHYHRSQRANCRSDMAAHGRWFVRRRTVVLQLSGSLFPIPSEGTRGSS